MAWRMSGVQSSVPSSCFASCNKMNLDNFPMQARKLSATSLRLRAKGNFWSCQADPMSPSFTVAQVQVISDNGFWPEESSLNP